MARFDRAIPPGGEGTITMKIDLKGFMGYVKKSSTVESNDPQNPRLVIAMVGRARPFILIQPSVSVSFRNAPGESGEKVVDLITNSDPFHVISVTNGVEGKASYRLETVEDGRHYRITVVNLLEKGRYGGAITVHTDMERKPKLTIYVRSVME